MFSNILNNKSNTHQTLWVGLGSLSSFALSLVSAAILSRYFDKEEYGTYRQILYVYNTLLIVFSAGLPRVYSYYLPRYSKAQGKDIVRKVTRILLIAGLTFSVFLFLFSGLIATLLKNPELSTGLKYFSIIPLLLLPTLGLEGIFSTYKQTIFLAIYNTVTRILMLIFIVLPVILFHGTYKDALMGWIVISVLTLIMASCFENIPFKNITLERTDLPIKEILSYSIPLAIASIAGIAIKAADQFYISRFFGPDVFAEFSNGFIELPFARMVTGAVGVVLMPLFSKMIKDQSPAEVIGIWHASLKKSAIIIYPMVIFFIFYSKEVMIILFTSKYAASSIYFSIAMAINFFNIIMFAPLLLSLGETKFYARLHILFAFSSWILGYVVTIVFNNPIALTVFSATQSILIIIISLIYTSKICQIRITSLFPIHDLFIVGFHSLVSLIIVKFFFNLLFSPKICLSLMIVISVSYAIILLSLAPIFKINYLNIVRPIFK